MKHFLVPMLMFGLALPALGQESPKPPGNQRAMYEDIEVMRTLLARRVPAVHSTQCAACHLDPFIKGFAGAHGVRPMGAGSGSGAAWGDFDNDGFADILVANHPHGDFGSAPAIEGSYLKGQGIVFRLTMPQVPPGELAVSTLSQPPRAMTDWEKTRRQIRGEKVEATPQAKRATVADALLKALAENGKNFSQLTENESVTLVVTFRSIKSTASVHGMMGAGTGSGGMAGPMGGGGMGGAGGGVGGPTPMGGAGAGPMGGSGSSSAAGGGGSAEPMTPDRELELLGDLHQKRGNWKDAASAYERALAKLRETTGTGQTARIRELVRKLAELHLNSGNLEEARRALQAYVRTDPKAADQSTPKAPAPKPAPAIKLPAKLIVSAPKKLLDQVGDGKITAAEFQKLVTLEVLTFDDAAGPK